MLRTTLLAALLALASSAQAGAVASCDALDAQNDDHEVRFDDADIDLDGEARADLDVYVAGFRKLSDDATTLGKQGGKIAAQAVGGLVSVLFTSRTLDDYERNMEAEGEKMEQRADSLCRTIAALQRTEQALQQRIPAFPNFIAPAKPAL